jgi:hypothetical protein
MARPRTSDSLKRTLNTWRADRHAKPRQPAPKGTKHTEAEEAELWASCFASGLGHFFAGDVEKLGFRHVHDANMVAAEAWTRLGPVFLEQILPTLGRPPALMPWALSAFGRPWEK